MLLSTATWARSVLLLLVITNLLRADVVAHRQASAPGSVTRTEDVDKNFAIFKARLLSAAETGDIETLIVSMTPDVSLDYDNSTPAAVMARYQVTHGRPWIALRDALRLGTTRENNVFVAPSTYSLDLEPDDAIVVAADARLRSEPNSDARILRVLARFQVVRLDRREQYDAHLIETSEEPVGREAWARVTTKDGQSGYVYGRHIWSADNSRFVFRRIGELWKLVSVAAGPG